MYTRRSTLRLLAAAPGLGAALALGLPGRASARTPDFFATDGVAIHGYDPVAYFVDGRPVPGQSKFRLKWAGAMWRFASADHRDAFEMNAYRYAPKYGGYCAYALSKGAIATTEPEAWTIHKDQLFLNYSTGVRKIWQKDIPGNITAANGYWPAILAR